ncbi:MAG: AAA family ATPase [Planctomycetota bacterium]|jgi:ATP-dependent Clp protease ATP-binding subunit ClpA
MEGYETVAHTLVQTLEEGVLAEAILFPEVSRLLPGPQSANRALKRNVLERLEDAPSRELPLRHMAGEPGAFLLPVVLDPPKNVVGFDHPVTLSVAVAHWTVGEMHVGLVPALEIEIFGETLEELRERVARHVRAALVRQRLHRSLAELSHLPSATSVELFRHELTAIRPTLIETFRRDRGTAQVDPGKRVVDEAGRELEDEDADAPEPAFEQEELVAQLAELVSVSRPRSLLLVGPSGVGKTQAFLELFRTRQEHGLSGRPFWVTSGARLVAGMSGYGMWQERCTRFCDEARKTRAIVHLGNLRELSEVGKSEHNAQGMASFLTPRFQRGEIVAVLECTPDELSRLESDQPRLLEALERVVVAEPDRDREARILRAQADLWVGMGFRGVTGPALRRIQTLHRRFQTISAAPGRALSFLAGLVRFGGGEASESAQALTESEVVRAFAERTGLPAFLLDDDVAFDLAQARAFLERRVRGQAGATAQLADLIATLRAGLAQPGRPLMSLLFVGPTGVGKTELAKALASYLFSSERRLVRLDMSEFQDEYSAQRLIGGLGRGEGVLTAPIRDQPFSVVLLDEIEKADGLVFDFLLQVLGEGRLTDGRGRLADFQNAVIILTSNLGADTFSAGSIGFFERGADAKSAQAHFVEAARRFFRPEMFNRIDRIVAFPPLTEETVQGIARAHLEAIKLRDGVSRRALELTFEPGVAERLARRGYDPRYGARPLKRAIERELLFPLADRLNTYDSKHSLEARVAPGGTIDEPLEVEVRGVAEASEQERDSRPHVRLRAFRRQLQRLRGTSAWRELMSERHRLTRWGDGLAPAQRTLAELAKLARLQSLDQVANGVVGCVEAACSGEEHALLRRLGLHQELPNEAELAQLADAVEEQFFDLLIDTARLTRSEPDFCLVALYAENRQLRNDLAVAYVNLCRLLGYSMTVYAVVRREPHEVAGLEQKARAEGGAGGSEPIGGFKLEPIPESRVKASELGGGYGLVLEIKGRAAGMRFEGEQGRHRLPEVGTDSGYTEVVVETSAIRIGLYPVPEGIDRRGFGEGRPLRRTFDARYGRVSNTGLASRLWDGKDLLEALKEINVALFRQTLLKLLEG